MEGNNRETHEIREKSFGKRGFGGEAQKEGNEDFVTFVALCSKSLPNHDQHIGLSCWMALEENREIREIIMQSAGKTFRAITDLKTISKGVLKEDWWSKCGGIVVVAPLEDSIWPPAQAAR